MCHRRIVLALLCSMLTSVLSMAADQADPQQKLETAIPEAIAYWKPKNTSN